MCEESLSLIYGSTLEMCDETQIANQNLVNSKSLLYLTLNFVFISAVLTSEGIILHFTS